MLDSERTLLQFYCSFVFLCFAKLSISMHPKSLGGSPIQDSLQKAAEEIRATADGESRSVLDFPVMGEGPRVFFPIISPIQMVYWESLG